MSTKGMKLGGVQTLDHVHMRCAEVGDCWEWKMYANKFGQAQTYFGGRVQSVRRVVWQLVNGLQTVPDGKLVSNKCNNLLCVAPEHLVLLTHAAHVKRSRAKGNETLRRARIAVTTRRTKGVAAEKVQAVRDSDEQGKVLAERLGISVSTVGNIRRGKRHALPATQSPWGGLFTGLMREAA